MKRDFLRDHGKNGFEVIEEAFVLLRNCPLTVLSLYFVGSAPFVAGVLVFWSQACHDPFAREHLVERALLVAGLFVWMKIFQTLFCVALLARLGGAETPKWSLRAILRVFINQTILQSSGLILLPMAALIALPFGWVYAFYQNATILDDGNSGAGPLTKQAIRHCQLWPMQNHLLLFVLPAFGLFVLINWITLCLIVPQFLRMFFGVESAFSQSPAAMLNSTFFAAMLGFTYLSLDPLIKSCYVLRCFYGKSLSSGADLRIGFARMARMAVFVVAVLFAGMNHAQCEESVSSNRVVTQENLDQAITKVSESEKYAWRETAKHSGKPAGLFERFFSGLTQAVGRLMDFLGGLIGQLLEWIFGKPASPEEKQSATGWMTSQLGLLYLALAIVAALFAVSVMRFLRKRKAAFTTLSVALPVTPDLRNEQTGADELPENDWLEMGRALVEQGDLRLALRAFYLALLAHLAGRSLVTIARHKSNRDYEYEVGRRGHALPSILLRFRENVSIINCTWYGHHEARPEMVGSFVANIEEIRRTT